MKEYITVKYGASEHTAELLRYNSEDKILMVAVEGEIKRWALWKVLKVCAEGDEQKIKERFAEHFI